MKIGIDATGVWGIEDGLLNGIIGYTVHIINNMVNQNNTIFYLYCRDKVPPQINSLAPHVFCRVFKSKNRKLLQQVRLPIAALFDRLDLMFFPFHSASIFCPCKSVVTIHDLHPYVVPERFKKIHSSEIQGSSLFSLINKVYWEKILKMASKRADKIIAVSQATKRDIVDIFQVQDNKIKVVYEGVDKQYFNLNSDGKDLVRFREHYNLPQQYILCVGTHAYKNIEGAIRSFSILKKSYQEPLTLVIAGNKNYLSNEIFQLVQDLDLESQILFTGFFPDEDMKYLYQCAEIFLFPSFYEGFGLPVLEAFACGTPVVTSKNGSLPEVAGEAAMLVDSNDPQDIAHSLLNLLTDIDLKNKKSDQGLKRIEKFSWEEAGKRTLEILNLTV